MSKLILLALLSGCLDVGGPEYTDKFHENGGPAANDNTWDVGEAIHVETYGAVDREQMLQILRYAILTWDDTLGPSCPFPWVLIDEATDDSHPIRFYDRATWPSKDIIGLEWKGYVEVLDFGDLNGMAYVTIHELGHTFGLVHQKPEIDPLSIMLRVVTNTAPSAQDAINARKALGCK